jgi:hypothetical protein
MRRLSLHVLLKLFNYCCTTFSPHKERHPIYLGKRTAGCPRNHHHTHNAQTSPSMTQPLITIWAWNRHITYWNRSNPLPARSTSDPSRWHTKTRTTMPLQFSLSKLHLNWAKLPNLWLGIFRHPQRSTMLVALTQRNWNPCLGIHGPCKSMILQGTTKNWTTCCRIHPQNCPIQHSAQI